ncbi:uncharacterized protein [Parasteatoda tepidariorum]|uniref:uncharacterized protein n=1 Tax=Parasteatoda tepidariorum TaxID=114398 RepID=UPI00077FD6A6|nr:uncharacterized protein LOC107442435 [Parasteatoda tepidariorum]
MTHLQKNARYDRPVPEPHFIPGYTGHCPFLSDYVGINYPWATHAVMQFRPDIAKRLSAMRYSDVIKQGDRTNQWERVRDKAMKKERKCWMKQFDQDGKDLMAKTRCCENMQGAKAENSSMKPCYVVEVFKEFH